MALNRTEGTFGLIAGTKRLVALANSHRKYITIQNNGYYDGQDVLISLGEFTDVSIKLTKYQAITFSLDLCPWDGSIFADCLGSTGSVGIIEVSQ